MSLFNQGPKRIEPSRAPTSPARSAPARAASRGLVVSVLAALAVLAGIAYVAWQRGGHSAQTSPGVLTPPVIAVPASPAPSSSVGVRTRPRIQSPGTGRADPFSPLVASSVGGPVVPLLPPPAAVPPAPAASGVAGPGSSVSAAASPGAGFVVAGIVGGAFKVAIIEREGETYIVRVGDRAGTATIVGIGADGVVLKQGGSVFRLVLAQVSGVTSLGANTGTPTATVPAAPAPSGSGGPQNPSGGTGRPSQTVPGTTTGAPAAPGTAQPASGPAQGGSPTGTPSQGQGVPADQPSSPAPAFPLIAPTNTAQPPVPPVMPAGSTVFTPQPKGGTSAPRVP
jgi:hypothetical protein